MKTLTIKIPDSVDISETEATSLLASKLYEKGSLSLGEAAKMAGYSKRDFIPILSQYNVSIFSYTESELENDIVNAKNYHL